MNVRVLVGRAFGKRVVAVDFGDVAIPRSPSYADRQAVLP
jgi:hypothetical protein